MVVREDEAVLGDDEARAGNGGGACLTEIVRHGDLGRDADDLLAGERIDLARGEIAGARGRVHRRARHGGDGRRGRGFRRGLGAAAAAACCDRGGAGADEPAQQRAHQRKARDAREAVLLRGFGLFLSAARRLRLIVARRYVGGVLRGAEVGVGIGTAAALRMHDAIAAVLGNDGLVHVGRRGRVGTIIFFLHGYALL